MPNFPKLLLIMRHAEKPVDPQTPDLSPAGYARAEALATYLLQTFPTIDFIFASAISKHSARPYETVRPLAKSQGIAIDATIADVDYPVLAHDLTHDAKFSGKIVVVCWHHGNIPGLMKAIGAPSGTFSTPWNDSVFNLILKAEQSSNGVITVAEIIEPF